MRLVLTILLMLLTPLAYASNVIIFDESNNRVVRYIKSANTPLYSSRSDVLVNPDLSAVASVPRKYWLQKSESIVEMSQAEKDTYDAEIAQNIKDFQIAAVDALSITVKDLMDAFNSLGIVSTDTVKAKIKTLKGLD